MQKTNKMMKKIYFFLVLSLFSFSSKLYANGGYGSMGIIFQVDNGSKTVYKVFDAGWVDDGCASWYNVQNAQDFNGLNIGSVSTLTLNGLALVGWTDNSDWISGQIEYKIWKQGDVEPSSMTGNYNVGGYGTTSCSAQDVQCNNVNNRKVGLDGGVINLLQGLLPGNYNFKVYPHKQFRYCGGSWNQVDNAAVAATFTVNEPSTITTGSIVGSTFCAGATVNIPYTTTGTFNSGNVFTAQLSNATGSFATSTTIGTLNSATSGTILATIPPATAYGTGYRIRVVSSNPSVDGSDNGANLTINPSISSAILHFPKTETVCDNAPFTAYGRIGITGITNNDATPSTLITAEFGYGTSASPTTWIWNPATFGVQGASINNTKDEYSYVIPSNTLTAGTTYYYGTCLKFPD